MKIAIFSDLHLKNDPKDSDHQKFTKLLDDFIMSKSLTHLWLLGDIFDLFIGPYNFYHEIHGGIFSRLRELHSLGCKIIWLEGNHDFHMNHVLNPYGVEVKDEVLELDLPLNSQQRTLKVILGHGDLVNENDKLYLKWREKTRHPIFRNVLNYVPDLIAKKFLLPFAEKQSAHSRKKTIQFMHDKQQDLRLIYRHYANQKFAEGYNGVFLGHCHIQDIYIKGSQFYFNMGSWLGSTQENPRQYGLWTPESEAHPKLVGL